MTEALTNPMNVDLRLWKEDFSQKGRSLINANQKAIISLLFMTKPITYPIILAILPILLSTLL